MFGPFMDKSGGWFVLAKCMKIHLWKTDILSKNGRHQHQGVFFTTFACKIQLTGFFIHGALA